MAGSRDCRRSAPRSERTPSFSSTCVRKTFENSSRILRAAALFVESKLTSIAELLGLNETFRSLCRSSGVASWRRGLLRHGEPPGDRVGNQRNLLRQIRARRFGAVMHIPRRGAWAALVLGIVISAVASSAAPATPGVFSLDRLLLGTGSGPENYMYTAGDRIFPDGGVDPGSFYRFV